MYQMKRRVTYSQVGSNLKADMAMVAHFFQDCALFHSESLGQGIHALEQTHSAWFLSSWQIEVKRYPEFGEEITVRTWPHAFTGIYGYRNFDILDTKGEQIVRANSIWTFMNLEKMCPAKPTAEDMHGYDSEPAIEMDYAPRKIKILDESNRIGLEVPDMKILVKPSFLDSNLHVNNGRYITEAMDFLPEGVEIMKMRVDYRKAAVLGDILYPQLYQDGTKYQVVFADGESNPFVIVEVMW